MSKSKIPMNSSHILVVEDDEYLREFLRVSLEGEGYQISVAKHGREACYLATEFHPDLVITDIFMPEMDGLVVIQQLSKLPAPPKIIAISGVGSDNHYLNMAKTFGASCVLMKPINMDDLQTAIKKALNDD